MIELQTIKSSNDTINDTLFDTLNRIKHLYLGTAMVQNTDGVSDLLISIVFWVFL